MTRKISELNTARKRKVILFINEFKANRDYSPNLREICDAVRITSTSVVAYYLKQLESEGLLASNRYEARTLRLTKAGKKYVTELLAVKGYTADVKKIVDDYKIPASLLSK